MNDFGEFPKIAIVELGRFHTGEQVANYVSGNQFGRSNAIAKCLQYCGTFAPASGNLALRLWGGDPASVSQKRPQD